MSKYGYIRVSSRDQNIDRQKVVMKQIGLLDQQLFIDKQSGKDFKRKNYQRMVRKLKKGDELYLKSIDRLGRDYDEILEQWRLLTKKKEIDIIVLDFPLLDTRNQIHGITGKFIADLALQILCYVAQVERENIKERQAEGIRIAKEKGVKFGRPQLPLPDLFEEVYCRYKANLISKREGARQLQTNHITFSHWIRRYEGEE